MDPTLGTWSPARKGLSRGEDRQYVLRAPARASLRCVESRDPRVARRDRGPHVATGICEFRLTGESPLRPPLRERVPTSNKTLGCGPATPRAHAANRVDGAASRACAGRQVINPSPGSWCAGRIRPKRGSSHGQPGGGVACTPVVSVPHRTIAQTWSYRRWPARANFGTRSMTTNAKHNCRSNGMRARPERQASRSSSVIASSSAIRCGPNAGSSSTPRRSCAARSR